jgi:hypothetical protein
MDMATTQNIEVISDKFNVCLNNKFFVEIECYNEDRNLCNTNEVVWAVHCPASG